MTTRVGDIEFNTPTLRSFYLGTPKAEQPQFLEQHKDKWRRVSESTSMAARVTSEIIVNENTSGLKSLPNYPAHVEWFKKRRARYAEWFPLLTFIYTGADGKKGRIETIAFEPDAAGNIDWDAVALCLADRNGRANCYYALNSVKRGTRSKADRKSVARVLSHHVDIDPRVGETPEQCKVRALKMAAEYKTQPTHIIDSGNGVQLIWDLFEPIEIDGDIEKAEDAKLWNIALEHDFGGDNCHNVDRILRIIETANIPDATKIAKGRQRTTAHLIGGTGQQYPLSAFTKAEPQRPKETKTTAAPGGRDIGPVTLESLSAAGISQDTIDLIREGPPSATGKNGQELGRGAIDFKVTSALVRAGLSNAAIKQAYRLGRISADADQWPRGFDGEMDRIIENARAKVGPVVSEHDHMARARTLASMKRPHLKHYRDDFTDLDGGRYRPIADSTIRAEQYSQLEKCTKQIKVGKGTSLVPFQPNTSSINETVNALKAVCHVPPDIDQPCWLDGRTEPNPADLVSFPNGILNLMTGEFMPPDPMLFTPHAVAFAYDPSAPDAVEFKKFLAEVFAGEQDQIDAIQEAFGYCMTCDVSQEKAFMLLGDKRSGKDTLRHVLQSLLPDGSICGPTLDSMGNDFGMSQFIGKSVAVVGDMRIGSKCDRDLLAENVLKLTGRGLFTINRKHKDHWTGSLPCKLWLISNERPPLKDTSGALASRFIVYRTRTSFYGREDPNLFRDKLAPELPGILLWALDGLRRMRERGRLAEPQASIDEREQLAREGSPVLAFVQECLELDPKAEVPKDDMHTAFNSWAESNGLFPKSKNVFMRDLETATGGKVRASRKQVDGKRAKTVEGARIVKVPPAQEGRAQDEIPF